MSTDLSKSDEVNDSLDSILNMDNGEDNILGQTFIGDLLDKDDGADIGGNQSDTQSGREQGATALCNRLRPTPRPSGQQLHGSARLPTGG